MKFTTKIAMLALIVSLFSLQVHTYKKDKTDITDLSQKLQNFDTKAHLYIKTALPLINQLIETLQESQNEEFNSWNPELGILLNAALPFLNRFTDEKQKLEKLNPSKVELLQKINIAQKIVIQILEINDNEVNN